MPQTKPVGVFLSDFHIGEDLGGVSRKQGPGYTEPVKGVFVRQEFKVLLDRLRQRYDISTTNRVPYLILLGDIWDLAVQPMDYTSDLSIEFFNGAALQDYFEEILYISGNHDHHLWRMYQAKRCEVDPLNKACGVASFPQEIPGILDCRGQAPSLYVDNQKNPAADTFISGLTGTADLPVHVVYPNLYIRTADESGGRSLITTHGHLFDPGWNLVTDYLPETIEALDPAKIDLASLEMLNSPVTEFWNYALAQVGSYNFIEKIYDGLLKGKIAEIFDTLTEEAMGDLKNGLRALYKIRGWSWDFGADGEKLVMGVILDHYKKIQAGALKRLKAGAVARALPTPRYDETFLARNQSRVASYLGLSQAVYDRECRKLGLPEDPFSTLVFGHTHVPLPNTVTGSPLNFPFASKGAAPPAAAVSPVQVYNTGGWVEIGRDGSPMPMALFSDGRIDPIGVTVPA